MITIDLSPDNVLYYMTRIWLILLAILVVTEIWKRWRK